MRRLTISLTDDEYAALEARAETERRTPKQMAEFVVTRPQPTVIMLPAAPQIQPSYPNVWPPNVIVGTTPNLSTYTTWTSPNTCDASGSQYPPLRLPTAGHQA